jgi:hypothetical protein
MVEEDDEAIVAVTSADTECALSARMTPSTSSMHPTLTTLVALHLNHHFTVH